MNRFLIFCALAFLNLTASAQLEPNDVLILVNDNSPTSKYIAQLYCEYYPDINQSQILYLTDPNLQDCSGPQSTAADEIITREIYETAIAEPVRAYLIDQNLVDQTKVIITTAGLPYRIEDSTFTNIVIPGGGTVYAASLTGSVDAASVESELTVLFQTDYNNPIFLDYWDRNVNPYQGYRNSPVELFDRDIINNSQNMYWRYPRKLTASHYPPMMEGRRRILQGVMDRRFSAGDMHLTCRLDGPKNEGQSAVFAVRKMLEFANRASDPAYGINEANTVAVLDDAPGATNFNYNRIYNLDRYVDFLIYEEGVQQPPDTYYAETRDDYDNCFEQMTGQVVGYDNMLYAATMPDAYDLTVLCDKRYGYRTNQADLLADEIVVAAACFGINGDEASPPGYILTGGPAGEPLFNLAYGAVYCSIESFNAVTMFSDASIMNQASIIDFLQIGGCGAIGHSFEPYSDAIIDTEFLFYNLLADSDQDGFADMTFIEAAFTAIPYLSWTEVVLGDPLMKIAYGPGGQALPPNPADIDRDGQPGTIADLAFWTNSYLGSLNSNDGSFNNYNDLCDFNEDGQVNLQDFAHFAGFVP